MDTYMAAKGKVGQVTSSAFRSFSGFIIALRNRKIDLKNGGNVTFQDVRHFPRILLAREANLEIDVRHVHKPV
jgi:hypothetical protein